MHRYYSLAIVAAFTLLAGCRAPQTLTEPTPSAPAEHTADAGSAVGDDRTAMQAAIDANVPAGSMAPDAAASATSGTPVLAPGAPDSYVVKRGDTLWGIAKIFLRDPWYWPEIWQVNRQIQNPHLIYPGDTLRLVYLDGKPRLTLTRGMIERGTAVRVEPRVRSEPLEAAITTIPYEAVAAFMSKPSVLTREQIDGAPYILAALDEHLIESEGNTVYARGFKAPPEVGTHYNIVRVGAALRDPDDKSVLGYAGIFTGAGRVTRGGSPATLIMTESSRETVPGDKLFTGGSAGALDFTPHAPGGKIDGRIIAVSDGQSVIGQYQVVVINRGARHGLVPGNVLGIFEVGGSVEDTFGHGFLGGLDHLGARHVRLPNERSGTFMVFKTFDRLSYGLIMEAKNIIHVGDLAQNP